MDPFFLTSFFPQSDSGASEEDYEDIFFFPSPADPTLSERKEEKEEEEEDEEYSFVYDPFVTPFQELPRPLVPQPRRRQDQDYQAQPRIDQEYEMEEEEEEEEEEEGVEEDEIEVYRSSIKF